MHGLHARDHCRRGGSQRRVISLGKQGHVSSEQTEDGECLGRPIAFLDRYLGVASDPFELDHRVDTLLETPVLS